MGRHAQQVEQLQIVHFAVLEAVCQGLQAFLKFVQQFRGVQGLRVEACDELVQHLLLGDFWQAKFYLVLKVFQFFGQLGGA